MPLALRTAAAVVRRDGNGYQHDEDLHAYHRDLLAPFGLEVDLDLLKQSTNIGFGELTEELLRRVPEPVDRPDLLLLAYAIPDIYPLKTVTAHLNYLLGGVSRSFAVSEQGLRAPFTALRIAQAYHRSGRCASLALFVCDQTTLPYRDPLVHDTPLVDSAALLVFETGPGPGGEEGAGDRCTFEFAGTRATAPGEPLGPLVAGLLKEHEDPDLADRTLIVAGGWTGGADPDGPYGLGRTVHRARPGTYCTGVWLELADRHRRWARSHDLLVLCDTDPRSGRGQAAVLRRPGTGPVRPESDRTPR